MKPTYRKLLKALHDKYPGKHISITPGNNLYDHGKEEGIRYKTEYYIYVEDIESKHLPTLSGVKLYVEYLCKREV